MAFAQSVKVHRMILDIAREPEQTFWNMTLNLLFDAAALEWAKVFGSRGDDTHWTKVLPADQHDATRAALLQHLGLTQAEWEGHRTAMLAYRDEQVAPHDTGTTIPNFPRYEVALKAACFMFDRVRATANQGQLGDIPVNLDRWSNTVAGNMKAIVRKAHAATATLGSNISDGAP
jgi:hypothetical protein